MTLQELEKAVTLRCINAHIEEYRFMKVSKDNIYPLFYKDGDLKFMDDDGYDWYVSPDVYKYFEVAETED